MRHLRTVVERLADRLLVGDGCWLWMGARDQHGYGQITDADAVVPRVHVVVYALLVGPVPDGLELDHTCRTKACARPAHLEPVTHRENTRRAFDGPSCRRGHLWTPETTYVRPDGRRECRTCKEQRWARWAATNRSAA